MGPRCSPSMHPPHRSERKTAWGSGRFHAISWTWKVSAPAPPPQLRRRSVRSVESSQRDGHLIDFRNTKRIVEERSKRTKIDLENSSRRPFLSSPENRPPAEKLPAPRWRQVKNLENYGYFCGPFLGGRKKKGPMLLLGKSSRRPFPSKAFLGPVLTALTNFAPRARKT